MPSIIMSTYQSHISYWIPLSSVCFMPVSTQPNMWSRSNLRGVIMVQSSSEKILNVFPNVFSQFSTSFWRCCSSVLKEPLYNKPWHLNIPSAGSPMIDLSPWSIMISSCEFCKNAVARKSSEAFCSGVRLENMCLWEERCKICNISSSLCN